MKIRSLSYNCSRTLCVLLKSKSKESSWFAIGAYLQDYFNVLKIDGLNPVQNLPFLLMTLVKIIYLKTYSQQNL